MQHNLISMTDFVFMLRNRTTSELCGDFPKNFKTPVWNGNKDDMVKDMLAIDAIQWRLTGEYAKFLIQPLALWMFVPCEQVKGVWEPMEEPKESDYYNNAHNDRPSNWDAYEKAKKAYQAAKERCLFIGFAVESHEENCYSVRSENTIFNVMWKFPLEEWRPSKGLTVIDDLSKLNLPLTPTALKQIYGGNSLKLEDMNKNKCGVLFPTGYGHCEHTDKNGCIKPEAHNDAHIFISVEGKTIQWEDDYNCTNDCDCWEQGGNCIIYKEIN